jgi:hypothetical protein
MLEYFGYFHVCFLKHVCGLMQADVLAEFDQTHTTVFFRDTV